MMQLAVALNERLKHANSSIIQIKSFIHSKPPKKEALLIGLTIPKFVTAQEFDWIADGTKCGICNISDHNIVRTVNHGA